MTEEQFNKWYQEFIKGLPAHYVGVLDTVKNFKKDRLLRFVTRKHLIEDIYEHLLSQS